MDEPPLEDDTAHLLSTAANSARLLDGLAEFELVRDASAAGCRRRRVATWAN
jgi:hypothetical protein